MDGVSWGAIAAVMALCCSLCSVASFYFGRRKAATDDAEEEGSLKTDINYIKETIKETTKSIESLSLKMDRSDSKREEDYRQLLVNMTELKASYKSLHIRVDNIEKQIDQYYHHT